MNAPRPVAIGYVCGVDDAMLLRQRTDVARYVQEEGLALTEVLHDQGDGFTISQIVQAAQLRHAAQVLLPADAHLADAQARLTLDLADHDAVCVVIGEQPKGSPRAHASDLFPARSSKYPRAMQGATPTEPAAPVGATADLPE